MASKNYTLHNFTNGLRSLACAMELQKASKTGDKEAIKTLQAELAQYTAYAHMWCPVCGHQHGTCEHTTDECTCTTSANACAACKQQITAEHGDVFPF